MESLREADYVLACVMTIAFIKEHRGADCAAKFVCADGHTGFFSQIRDAQLWDEIDGSLIIRGGSVWWNEEGPLIDLTRRLLHENDPGEAEEIVQAGSPYLAISGIFYPMFELIANTVHAVGADNFSSQALYDAAKSYSLVIDGVERSGFTETRRYALSNYMVYKASAADEDIIKTDQSWIPHLVEP